MRSKSEASVSTDLEAECLTIVLAGIYSLKGDYAAAKKLVQPFWEMTMESSDTTAQVDSTEALALALFWNEEYTLAKSVIEKCLSTVQGAGRSVDLYYR